MNPERPFEGKTVLVTGGSRGIGRACVRAFARYGADVVLTYRSHAEAAEALVREIERSGGRARCLRWDAAEPDGPGRAMEEALRAFGRLDHLVLNAGRPRGPGESLEDPRLWRRSTDEHVVAAYRWVEAALPELRRRRGSVGLVGSVASRLPFPSQAPYAAAKAAQAALVRTLAVRAAPEVRVNAVLAGWIRTDATEPLWNEPEASARIVARIPLGRWGEPEEVAEALAFLASDGARFVTGELLVLDGGQSIYWSMGGVGEG